ncbi:hypothetical protein [Paenibacillus senegalimassiliensis]|uniref:hypothetical protein n=1 Tax=Paenibacillus senegalimassiliensis TaxID=1737426 RepID=UPI00073E94B5|nr:hypothetical protein [Paenibacillus senegalimassiliensis]
MNTKICDKHKEHPAKIYSKCIGCEIDMLQQRIKEQEELLKWHRSKGKPDKERADALYKTLERVRDYLDRDIYSLAYHELEQALYGGGTQDAANKD